MCFEMARAEKSVTFSPAIMAPNHHCVYECVEPWLDGTIFSLSAHVLHMLQNTECTEVMPFYELILFWKAHKPRSLTPKACFKTQLLLIVQK